jgi:hypothetical protein
MNTFLQHIPNFVDTDRPEAIEFETTQDLLMIDKVKQWVKPIDGKEFSHFALSGKALIVVHDEGFHWWVVGYIERPDEIDLPRWYGGKYRAELPSGERVTLSNEVVSSCGDILTLRDGSTAKNIR